MLWSKIGSLIELVLNRSPHTIHSIPQHHITSCTILHDIHTHAHTHMHTLTYTHTLTHTHSYTHTHIYTHTLIYTLTLYNMGNQMYTTHT